MSEILYASKEICILSNGRWFTPTRQLGTMSALPMTQTLLNGEEIKDKQYLVSKGYNIAVPDPVYEVWEGPITTREEFKKVLELAAANQSPSPKYGGYLPKEGIVPSDWSLSPGTIRTLSPEKKLQFIGIVGGYGECGYRITPSICEKYITEAGIRLLMLAKIKAWDAELEKKHIKELLSKYTI